MIVTVDIISQYKAILSPTHLFAIRGSQKRALGTRLSIRVSKNEG